MENLLIAKSKICIITAHQDDEAFTTDESAVFVRISEDERQAHEDMTKWMESCESTRLMVRKVSFSEPRKWQFLTNYSYYINSLLISGMLGCFLHNPSCCGSPCIYCGMVVWCGCVLIHFVFLF